MKFIWRLFQIALISVLRDYDVGTQGYFMTTWLNNRLRVVLSPVVQGFSNVVSCLCLSGAEYYYISECGYHITKEQMRTRKECQPDMLVLLPEISEDIVRDWGGSVVVFKWLTTASRHTHFIQLYPVSWSSTSSRVIAVIRKISIPAHSGTSNHGLLGQWKQEPSLAPDQSGGTEVAFGPFIIKPYTPPCSGLVVMYALQLRLLAHCPSIFDYISIACLCIFHQFCACL